MRHGQESFHKTRKFAEVALNILGRVRRASWLLWHELPFRNEGSYTCVKSQCAICTIPVKELWEGFNPKGFWKGTFVLFRGYIDESYDNAQKIFAMSCLIAKGSQWWRMERAWKLHLAAVNRELKKQRRSLISRYHASDCSTRRNEFKGWTYKERDNLVL